jgi:hypothetical protein
MECSRKNVFKFDIHIQFLIVHVHVNAHVIDV